MFASQAIQISKSSGTYRETALSQRIKHILYFNKYNYLMQKIFVLKTSLWNKNAALEHSPKKSKTKPKTKPTPKQKKQQQQNQIEQKTQNKNNPNRTKIIVPKCSHRIWLIK